MKKYGYLSIDDTVTINKSVNLIFIAMANELCIYYEVLQSPYLKQWKNAIKSEFVQLKKAKIFKYVDLEKTLLRYSYLLPSIS